MRRAARPNVHAPSIVGSARISSRIATRLCFVAGALRAFAAFFGVEEDGVEVGVVRGCLRESIGDDGGLGEFDAEAWVDYWVEESGEHDAEHVVRLRVALEYIVVDHVLVPFFGYLALEEGEVVLVVVLIANVLHVLLWVVEVFDDVFRLGGARGVGRSCCGGICASITVGEAPRAKILRMW